MEAGRAEKDDATYKKEKQRKRLQKRSERIVGRTRSLQALFPRFDASRMASRAPNLLSANSQRNIPARLAALKSHLPEVDVERLVRSGPDLLTYNVDKVLGPRISELRRLFPDFPRMVMAWPGILTHDVQTYTVRKMTKLSELLPGVDIARLVSRYPMMLSLDIEGNVKPRLEGLAQLLPGHDITAMIGKVPRLLGCDLTKIEQKVSSLRWLLGPEANLNKILRSNPDLMISNVETTVAAKLRLLQELFPEAEVVSMVERDSKVLFYDIEGSVKVKVDCWRERVTNATELDEMLVAHPGILSNSLHVSVSRLDFLIETNSTEISATQLFKVVKTRRKEWSEAHGDDYRTFLEQKVSGPPVLRLWPGLYFDSDPNSGGNGDSRGKREQVKATMQGDDVLLQIGSGTKTNPASWDAQLKALEKKYGTIIKEAQLRFSSALREGTRGETPTEIDMVVYDLKKFDQQVRKLAMARRLKRFRELLPELKTDRLFTDYPNVMLMDLKKVEERIVGLRDLLGGRDVSAAVSIVPQILLHDVQLCLRPRMTRLIVALTRNQLEGALDAKMVKNMVSRCPELLLRDVRNVVVPSLQYVLSCTSDHDELGKRLYKDPSLLVVGVAPLARLQYSLEEHRRGVALIPLGKTGSGYFLPAGDSSGPSAGTADGASPEGDSDGAGEQRLEGKEDPTRLLPPLVVPQILKCQLRDFLDRNPEYTSFLAQRQGLQATKGDESDVSGVASVDGGQRSDGVGPGAARAERASQDESGQVAFWERAVGARLSEKFRPLDSPYAREKLKMIERGQKGPEGQRIVVSELDLLIGDVLYFNNRMRVLLKDKIRWMPQAVDVGQEAVKLAEDVEWASRQISRLLGLSSLSKGDQRSLSAEQQQRQQQRQRYQQGSSWVSNALETLRGLATRATRDGNAFDADSVVADPGPGRRPQQANARVIDADADSEAGMPAMEDIGRSRSEDCSLETAIELEKLLGEVSSFEDRLEGLLSNQASQADEGMDGGRETVRGGDPAGESPKSADSDDN